MTAGASAGDQWTSGRAYRTVRATANSTPSRGHCPSLKIRVSRRSGMASRVAFRILRFCPCRCPCDHHDDSSQSSEMTTVMTEMLLCASLPAPRSSRTLVSCAVKGIRDGCAECAAPGHGHSVARPPLPPDPPPLRTPVYPVSVVATPGSTPNSSSSEHELLALSRTAAHFASTSARSRGWRGGASLFAGTARIGLTRMRMRLMPAPAPSKSASLV